MSLPKFENLDSRITYYPLQLRRKLDHTLPVIELPQGFHFVFYQPGDRDAWIEIEKSAGEFSTYQEGLQAWQNYYGGHEDELTRRMIFVTADAESYPDSSNASYPAAGRKVATATAYYDNFGRDPYHDGWLHWVSVRKDFQGKGLSKPLILHTLDILRDDFKESYAQIPTQCTTWLAVKVYLDLGFLPMEESLKKDYMGWRIVKRLTDHPALAGIEAAPDEEGLSIREVTKNKKDYLDLLLLADEQEDMIDRYLERGTMFVKKEENTAVAECVVTDEGGGILEIQNLAVRPAYQGKGHGKAIIEYVADRYKGSYSVLQVGTGDSPLTVPFYQHCGFTIHHVIPNYIVDHYRQPIFEGGKQLKDKVYLWRKL